MSMISLKKKVTTKLTDIAKSSIGTALQCSCQYCKGPTSGGLTQRNLKLHFLMRRRQEIEEIKSVKESDRLSFIEAKVDKALEYARTLSKEGIEIADLSHLTTWNNLIQQFKKKS